MKKAKDSLWVLGVFAFVSVCVFGRSVSFDFVYDDHDFIQNNPYIRDSIYIIEFFRKPLWELSAAHNPSANVFHPLQLLSYFIQGHLFSFQPFGFHAVSIVWHVLVTFLFYMLMQALSFSRRTALFTALLFSVHPTTSEVVYFISSGIEPMMIAFVLLALLIGWGQWKIAPFLFTVSFLAALFSKEDAIILIPALFFGCFSFSESSLRKRNLLAVIGILAVCILYFVLRAQIANSVPVGNFLRTPLYSDWWKLLLRYLELSFLPFSPVGFREYLGEPITWTGIIAVGFVAALIGLSLSRPPYRRQALFFLLIAIPSIALAASLSLISGTICDRYVYASLLGWFGLVACTFPTVFDRPIVRNFSFCFLVILGSFSFLAGTQWKDELHLWTFAAEANPNSSAAYRNLGAVQFEKGDWVSANESFERALKLSSPTGRTRRVHLESLQSLAGLAHARGDSLQAARFEDQLKKVREMHP